MLSSLQKKEVYATAIWHDGLAFGDGTGRYHVQQTEAGDVADQRALARACVVENSHLPNGGLGQRGTVGNEGVGAEPDVAHAQIVGAWVAPELTLPAGMKGEALAGGRVCLGNGAGALVLGAWRDQVLGPVAQPLPALGPESLVCMEGV